MSNTDAVGSRAVPQFTIRNLLPGLAAAGLLAGVGIAVRDWCGSPMVSPMVVAMVLGIAVRNSIGVPTALKPGLAISLRPILRLGIVLLGFRLTLDQIGAVGLAGGGVIVATLCATFLFTKALGRVLGVDARLAELIAAGTSVCGASAVLATNTVTRGSDEDVAYAIACVTVFGSVSMLLFPFLAGPLGLSAHDFGLWAGASIHEVAQVVGAGFAQGDTAGEFATIAKLSRVVLLAPLVLSLGFVARRRGGNAGTAPPKPWFVFGFVLVVALNSAMAIPTEALSVLNGVSGLMLTMALGAMGLETDIGKLRQEGLRPLILGAVAWVFVSGTALVMIRSI
ncbi:YeiH family putative sulfate export transporter [Rhodospirillaceae bacterium KN72]|uniref:YeiH family putative sulfate export transporter n=1 Tax=Pacificispira spongiicola TaxID=2729598 RepID=A0A7Y0HF88_9PROT|nr:YeiH family protein [Pacificispira spongiicola]NMM45636.1 YeiH family putative sulfate export transporter [Pacificispira spongiicola]